MIATLALAFALALTPATVATPTSETDPHCRPVARFDWDWTYPTPTCDGLLVAFPDDLPDSQLGVVEFNVHTSAGSLQFRLTGDDYRELFQTGHAGVSLFVPWCGFTGADDLPGEWTVTWVQVHGSNYHWQGAVTCTEEAAGPDPEVDPGTPVDPEEEVGPGAPVDPEDGTGPGTPVDPEDGTDPSAPVDPDGGIDTEGAGTEGPVAPEFAGGPACSTAGTVTTASGGEQQGSDPAGPARDVLAATGSRGTAVAGVAAALIAAGGALLVALVRHRRRH
ncbi:hypothetical protein [Cellulomonas denverensis]|uniref:Gram-positive cocci surface proteins LPxTG domain-containing protein n=1 Tax=Cellulomonas denverensis TaxID=264297 RepID=A0A7X6R0R3_9CELL|nr:hypothetical protein [Cellulomonas denverensis]NKY24594.1 hypothetical protein [Cellulomonas denverensis]GIG25715.1 hypothetical protein Cde04nite_19590 [Cellulomonas denverensis]